MDKALSTIASTVRGWMILPARVLNKLSGGRIRPNHITLVSLLGHFLVVWALWQHHPIIGGLSLAFFGIMDSLDGALARLQKTSSTKGMLFDAASDRVKEVLVYIGLIEWTYVPYHAQHSEDSLFFSVYGHGYQWIIIAICGMSLVVSYIKAKGEMALSSTGKHTSQELNRIFADGVARYEVRMALIIFGLLSGTILTILPILLVLVTYTALQRIIRVSRALKDV